MRFPLLVAAALCASSVVAHADVFQTFDASGTFDDGATLSGTLTIDTTTGVVTGSDLTVSSPDSFTFATVVVQEQGGYGPGEYSVDDRDVPANTDLDFEIYDAGSLVGYGGGPVSGNLYDLTTSTGYNGISDGVLTPTPEPTTFALLATGLLGVAGVLRKRFA